MNFLESTKMKNNNFFEFKNKFINIIEFYPKFSCKSLLWVLELKKKPWTRTRMNPLDY